VSNFVTIDFETANAELDSICQVGVVRFENGIAKEQFVSLVNPQSYFSSMNMAIHGIDEIKVKNAPIFQDVYHEIIRLFQGDIVISHGRFDFNCMDFATYVNQLEMPNNDWLNSQKIVRRALPQFSQKGYSLQNVAQYFSLNTNPHDALDDALTCGIIVNKLLEVSKTHISDWRELIKTPLTSRGVTVSPQNIEPNPDGEFYGENIIFTGTLSIIRAEAQMLAAEVGFNVHNNIRKDTTYLIVGEEYLGANQDHEKSTKQLKVEEMISKGQKVRILSEKDFLDIVKAKA